MEQTTHKVQNWAQEADNIRRANTSSVKYIKQAVMIMKRQTTDLKSKHKNPAAQWTARDW